MTELFYDFFNGKRPSYKYLLKGLKLTNDQSYGLGFNFSHEYRNREFRHICSNFKSYDVGLFLGECKLNNLYNVAVIIVKHNNLYFVHKISIDFERSNEDKFIYKIDIKYIVCNSLPENFKHYDLNKNTFWFF